MKAILFDLDGVIYESDGVIAGAAGAIEWFRQRNIPHLFLTNTSSRPRRALVEKLAGFGIQSSENEFLTPPVAAQQWLRHHVKHKVACFVTEATRSEFEQFDLTDDPNDNIDAVVIGDIGEAWNFATLNRAFLMLMNNPQAHLIALGMTRYWKAAGGLQLDAGPFVAALEYATDRKPLVMGKPAKKFYQAALAMLAVAPEQTVMIGDDIVGDIKAAIKRDFHTVLVRTGKFSESDLERKITPDAVLDSIADLPDYWESVSPDPG
jgi:phospholysine phosphohistidine inorganic pyrophosphate phosphatase